jgi:hypothetical protein
VDNDDDTAIGHQHLVNSDDDIFLGTQGLDTRGLPLDGIPSQAIYLTVIANLFLNEITPNSQVM